MFHRVWFIPASAGAALLCLPGGNAFLGLSPRARGRRGGQQLVLRPDRFIPARAGAGGAVFDLSPSELGFIPAPAGPFPGRSDAAVHLWVHPPARGATSAPRALRPCPSCWSRQVYRLPQDCGPFPRSAPAAAAGRDPDSESRPVLGVDPVFPHSEGLRCVGLVPAGCDTRTVTRPTGFVRRTRISSRRCIASNGFGSPRLVVQTSDRANRCSYTWFRRHPGQSSRVHYAMLSSPTCSIRQGRCS